MPKLDKETRRFTEVYSEYYHYVFSTVYTKVGNVDDVKDICQEVFMRFYNKFKEVENSRKWLLGAIRNVVLEYYRSKEKNYSNIDDNLNDLSLTYVNGFRDTRILIQEAIDDLDNFSDETDKLIFDLIAVNNYTYTETGEYLGLTKRQIKYKYSMIVNRLVKYFNNKGIKSLEDLL